MKEIKINVNDDSVFEARENLNKLAKEYDNLSKEAEAYSNSTSKDTATMAKYNEQLAKTKNELDSLSNSIKEADPYDLTKRFDELYKSTLPLNTQIGELEDRLYAMRLAGESNTAEFKAITDRVSDMKLVIQETDREIDNMVDNKGVGGLTNSFGLMGESIANLDFAGATKAVGMFNNSLNKIDPKKMGADFATFAGALGKGVTNGLKLATKATLQFTVALLANPITWIVIGIVALVAAIYKLLDAFGLITPVINMISKSFEFLGKVFDKVKQAMKDFSDWLGMTNYAEQDAANEASKRHDKRLTELEEENIARNGKLNNELKLLQAKGVNTEKEIWYETWLKNEILRNEKEKTQANIDAINSKIKMREIAGDLSDEEKKEIEEQRKELNNLRQTIKDIDTDIEANIISTNEKIKKNRETEQKNQDSHNKTMADKRKAEAEKAKAEADKEGARIAELRKKALEDISKIEDETKINLEKTAWDKEYKRTELALTKERDLLLANETLTQEEKIKIKEHYNNLLDIADKKRAEDASGETRRIIDKDTEIELKLLAQKMKKIESIEKKSLKDLLDIQSKGEEIRRKELQKELDDVLNDKTLSDEQKLALEKYYQDELTSLAEDGEKERAKISKDFSDTEADATKDRWSKISDITKEGFESSTNEMAAMTMGMMDGINDTFSSITEALGDEEASLSEKATAIAGAVLGLVSNIMGSIAEAQREKVEAQMAELEESSEVAMSNLDSQLSQGLISQEEYDRQAYALELQKYNKEEALKKAAFEQDKKMKIAQATIGMIQGMVGAFSSAMSTYPAPAGAIIGAAMAAVVGVMGAINIAKIKATKYQAGAPPTPSAAPAVSMPSIGDSSGTSTGNSNEYSQGQSATLNPNSSTATTNVNVSITEIEDTRQKVNKFESASEL